MESLFVRVLTLSLTDSAGLLPLLLLAPRLRGRYAAGTLSVLWLVLALRMALPVPLSLPWTAVTVDVSALPSVTLPADPRAPAEVPEPAGPESVEPPRAVPPAAAPEGRPLPLLELAAWVWLAGGLALAGYQGAAYLLTRRRLLRGAQPGTEEERAQLAALAAELGLRRTPRLLRTGEADAPLVVGLGRPVLLLPGRPLPADEREVVLLHGYGLDRTMWAPQLVALEGWTVLNLDIRGHGDSRPCAAFSIPQAAEDLRAVLVKERCRAPVLVGLSMGGYVVQEYAWQFGGCAGYLVAGATPILLDCYSGWERAGLRASTPLLGGWPWGCLKSAMAMACSSTEEGRAAVRRMFDQLTRREFLRGWRGIAQCLHPEKHFSFDAPLLVCRGERDRTGTIARHMEDWKRAWPETETAVLPGAAHVVNLDAPEAFNRLLLDFLTRCGGSRRGRR